MKCPKSIELLPWLLNGSLEEAQRDELLAHLAGCRACGAELDEAAIVWELATLHVPSRDLAAWAHGLPPLIWSREQLERHLAVCSSCRRELNDVGAAVRGRHELLPESVHSRVVPMAAWRRRRAVRRTALPLAAALGGILLLGFWLRLQEPEAPREIAAFPQAREETLPPGAVLFADGFESGPDLRWSNTSADGLEPEPETAVP